MGWNIGTIYIEMKNLIYSSLILRGHWKEDDDIEILIFDACVFFEIDRWDENIINSVTSMKSVPTSSFSTSKKEFFATTINNSILPFKRIMEWKGYFNAASLKTFPAECRDEIYKSPSKARRLSFATEGFADCTVVFFAEKIFFLPPRCLLQLPQCTDDDTTWEFIQRIAPSLEREF